MITCSCCGSRVGVIGGCSKCRRLRRKLQGAIEYLRSYAIGDTQKGIQVSSFVLPEGSGRSEGRRG